MKPLEIFAVIALIGMGAWIALRLRRWFAAITLRRRFAIGAQAEKDAVPLLERHGYTILDEQATAQSIFWVDGVETACTVRADLLAEKDGQQFVVEVKSGDSAPDPKYSATRRQLLEYEHVFRRDGMLLADMRGGTLKRVTFGLQGTQPRGQSSLVTWVLVLFAATAGLFLGHAL